MDKSRRNRGRELGRGGRERCWVSVDGGGKLQKRGPDDLRISSEVQMFIEGLPQCVLSSRSYFSTVPSCQNKPTTKSVPVQGQVYRAIGSVVSERELDFEF